MTLVVGDAQVDRVEEQHLEVAIAFLTDDADFIARRIPPLPRGFLDPDTMTFQFTCQSWIIQVDGRTVLVDPCNGNGRAGRPAPEFIADTEYARWDTDAPEQHPNDFNVSVFDESVRPVVAAGLARIVSVPYEVSPSLTIEPAPGHTVGHAMLRLASRGACAFFVGDVVHHPVRALVFPAHFPAPHHGRIDVGDDEEFVFLDGRES
jgi:hypothetical protein